MALRPAGCLVRSGGRSVVRGVLAVAGVIALAGSIVSFSGTAIAASPCPSVDPVTGAVSPAPTAGVNWSGCDLSHANLTEANLSGASLIGTNLTQATMNGVYLNNANLTGAILDSANLFSAAIYGADLNSADLENADLEYGAIGEADLSNADLSGANLANLYSRDITGPPAALPANWQLIDAYLVGPKAYLDVAHLDGADLSGADLAGATLAAGSVIGANLAGANLSGADLMSENLTAANLSGANLTGADLYGVQSAQLTGVPVGLPAPWVLRGGYLLGPGAYLYIQDLTGFDFTGTDLERANLFDDNLTAANLAGVSLANATIAQSDLTGADLFGVNVTGVNWRGSICPGVNYYVGPPDNETQKCTVGFFFGGFTAPRPNAVIRARAITVQFKLRATFSGGTLTSAIANDLIGAQEIRVVLSGQRMHPVAAFCAWSDTTSVFQCRVKIPSGIKTGKSHPYLLTAQEEPQGTFVKAPVPAYVGTIINPIRIYFR
jgi:uncharacterized protein YjbI with pentapeptide repeats